MTGNMKLLYNNIACSNARGAWKRGVREYALDIINTMAEDEVEVTEVNALMGASDWHDYSYGGFALVYNRDIAARLCSDAEYTFHANRGFRSPNSCENWLDVQTRALRQAWELIKYWNDQIERNTMAVRYM